MKLSKLLFVFGIFVVFSSETKAQTAKEEPVSNNNAALKEEALKAQARRNKAKQVQDAKLATANKVIVKDNIDENDTYMGRKAEFLGNLTVNELPTDFPKYDKSYGLRYYNNLVDNYYGAHKDILKEKVRQKIEHHYPSGNNNQSLNTK
jgi:hypothetical protein